jgi:hypothetical protein
MRQLKSILTCTICTLLFAGITRVHSAPAPKPATMPTAGPPKIESGSGSFIFVDEKGDPDRPIPVWTWAPDDRTPTTPILFVMHGTHRDASNYRDTWIPHAKAKDVILIVPEFSQKEFPHDAYNDGNMFDKNGKLLDKKYWGFTVVEDLFDEVKSLTGNTSEKYYLFGHSAGGQFVERFILCMPNARYVHAVPANPGWYTLPNFDKAFPAGLKNSLTTPEVLARICQKPVTLMLGEKDVDPNDPDLPRMPDAMAEGPYRFARGQLFFKELQQFAASRDLPLTWELKTVPNAKHSDKQMSPAAADVLFPSRGT